jgi:hypothetical protein
MIAGTRVVTGEMTWEAPFKPNAVDYVAVNVGQAEVAPAVAICQPRVVEDEQMQNCRVKVVDVDLADGY